jgi:hypothetical protein
MVPARDGIGFVDGFGAVVPAGDPRPAAPSAPGCCCCRGGDGPGPGAVHGSGGQDLKVVHGPGKLLGQARVIGCLVVVRNREYIGGGCGGSMNQSNSLRQPDGRAGRKSRPGAAVERSCSGAAV